MANETPSDPPTKPEKKPRSKVEKIVVWSFIGLLVLVAGAEAMAMFSYQKTIENFEDATDNVKEPITLQDFESKYRTGLTIKTTGNLDDEPTVLYIWPCISQKYKLHLTKGKDDVLKTWAPGNGPGAMIPSSSRTEVDELGGDLSEEGGETPIDPEPGNETPVDPEPENETPKAAE